MDRIEQLKRRHREEINMVDATDTQRIVDPAAICSAWWMYDNHTFQKVDITKPNWRGYVMTCYNIDGFGSFFVRESPNGKTIFDLHGRGKEGREAFAAALAAWTPPNVQTEATAGASPESSTENHKS